MESLEKRVKLSVIASEKKLLEHGFVWYQLNGSEYYIKIHKDLRITYSLSGTDKGKKRFRFYECEGHYE